MARCLSANECDLYRTTGAVCETCQRAEDIYVERTKTTAIRNAIRVLEANGYTVTKAQRPSNDDALCEQ